MAILDADKLAVYNGALLQLGARKLSSLTENREPRRVLDDVWGTENNAVGYALERAEWNFAIRALEGAPSDTIVPRFGFKNAFTKPNDLRRLASLSADEYFRTPLTNDQYIEEGVSWLTDYDVIYVRYVSDDTNYGFASMAWTESFRKYLERYLAHEACERITHSTSLKSRLFGEMRDALAGAKSNDAMGEGVKFPPAGSWARSRSQGRRGGRQ